MCAVRNEIILTNNMVEIVLHKCDGDLKMSARFLKCTSAQLRKFVKQSDEMADVYLNILEDQMDVVEKTAFQLAVGGQKEEYKDSNGKDRVRMTKPFWPAIKHFLDTRGKTRGLSTVKIDESAGKGKINVTITLEESQKKLAAIDAEWEALDKHQVPIRTDDSGDSSKD